MVEEKLFGEKEETDLNENNPTNTIKMNNNPTIHEIDNGIYKYNGGGNSKKISRNVNNLQRRSIR